jgi:uncharacterized protein
VASRSRGSYLLAERRRSLSQVEQLSVAGCRNWLRRLPQLSLMAEPNAPEAEPRGIDAGIYVDSSALAKLYVPEAESDKLDAFLHGRRDLMISELAVTEVLSAVARRKREGVLDAAHAYEIRDAVLADAESGSFHRLDLNPRVHREAERLLLGVESVPLRTPEALHVALALSAPVSYVLTYDARMRAAVLHAGLKVIEP